MRTRAKVYRDPVHDMISFRDEPLLGELVSTLLDCPEVQRLRFIRQLGLASLAYPGAEHSRFAHSLGVAHVAHRMCQRLRGMGPEQTRCVVAAALLHDVGHAPFSHVFERVFHFHHETWSARMVLESSTTVHRVLAAVDEELPAQVVGRLRGDDGHFSREIVSSQLDADRCDYLLRDSLMTGIAVGRFDLERILCMLSHDEAGLLVDERAWEAVEGYLLARYHMYRLVYFHHAVRAAEAMLVHLFGRAKRLMEAGDCQLSVQGALGCLMRGDELDVAGWSELRDPEVWVAIASWRAHPDRVLARVASALLDRRLWKPMSWESAGLSPEGMEALEHHVRDQLQGEERDLFVVDVARDTPYRPYVPGAASSVRGIRLRTREGGVVRIEDRSPIVRTLAESAGLQRRWFVDPLLVPKVRRVVGEALGEGGGAGR